MSQALLPCPFCGNETPEFERVGSPRQSCIVICGSCGARHESSDEGSRNGSSWNQRAASDATPPATAAGPSDAERYQWLRENNAYSIHDRLFADCPMNKFNDAMLDAAIDAAMRATKGGKL